MQKSLAKRLVRALRNTADKIDAGNSELTEEEAISILSVVAHNALSKEQACEYVNKQRSQFDNLIAAGKLPKGRKRRGYKELVWYEDELDAALDNIKNQKSVTS